MNLREDKHWSYGAGTFIFDARGQRPFLGYAPVQSDKTKESMVELRKELSAIVRDRPAGGDELKAAQDNLTLSLPGSRETINAVGGSIADIVQFGLPDNYFETYPKKVRDLTTQDMSTAAEKLIRPDKLVWVVVGDRSKIEQGVRELNFGEVKFLDADGNPVN
jgi:zinc protease